MMNDTFANALLALLFDNTNLANFGDATGLRGSTLAGNLYLSLHTADTGNAGDQTTNEANYTGYARIPVARGTGWTAANRSRLNAGALVFGTCTAGSNSINYVVLGTQLTGSGMVVARALLSTTYGVTAGVTPRLLVGALTISVA